MKDKSLTFGRTRMKAFAKTISRRGPLRVLKRLIISVPNSLRLLGQSFSWSFKRTEDSNFYYEVTGRNKKHLANFLAVVFNKKVEEIEPYILEAEACEAAKNAIETYRAEHPEIRDSKFFLGRRIAWYVAVRVVKPKTVLETGVHQGLGALAICCALKRNQEDGVFGGYIGTDINSKAGLLLAGATFDFTQILIGDSIKSINSLDREIDLYVSDSNHSQGYELEELLAVKNKLSEKGIVISDNSHATDVLLDWSRTVGRRFMFFREESQNHWSPGGGLGVSWVY